MRKIILLIMLLCVFFTACNFNGGQDGDKDVTATKIMPLSSTVDLNNLTDCTVAVSLNKGDVYVDDAGIMQMKATVYDYELYDMVDISQLEEGDIIVIGKKDVLISSLERNNSGALIINGGLDQGGHELVTDESGVFYETGYNDAKSYYPVGETTIRVSTDFEYSDKSILDEEEKRYYPGDFLVEDSGIDYSFNPHNTSIVISNGQVISMNRVYVP